MRTLHSDGRVDDDAWRLLGSDEPLGDGDVLIPLARWQSSAAEFANRPGRVGVWLENTDEPETLGAEVLALPLLAVRFPAFNDGRGLSTAVLLRTRCRYTGELRAIGDVQIDQLSYMRRCGFSSFALAAEADTSAFAARLDVMSDYYQGSVSAPLPLFRRR